MRKILAIALLGTALTASAAWAQSSPSTPPLDATTDPIVQMHEKIAAADHIYDSKVAAARKIFEQQKAAARKVRDAEVASARNGVSQ
jgi:hypothetical protein